MNDSNTKMCITSKNIHMHIYIYTYIHIYICVCNDNDIVTWCNLYYCSFSSPSGPGGPGGAFFGACTKLRSTTAHVGWQPSVPSAAPRSLRNQKDKGLAIRMGERFMDICIVVLSLSLLLTHIYLYISINMACQYIYMRQWIYHNHISVKFCW